ncbi:hypothetical protein GOZ78_03935 [Agrobacterium vitis]|uniref:Uncharacterized protein n=1 Tax=Agrobacterium vitis TaxID=373 RepID=A0ABD6G7Z7_AGRVI|nr:hypothetical protein [Agrobacterium vitis]MUO77997.1 hypothetical protein [Agrobacterium vitis]MUO96978.1 hypothetical protein [Agrobacterium vitis]MUP04866.1 hypothetical protein [Agrobacterium vitis]MUZ80695.1 hypothetical protein [Agrobacterium vitis]MVA09169.1 hypothetical protein [Agrobacterium vitis]
MTAQARMVENHGTKIQVGTPRLVTMMMMAAVTMIEKKWTLAIYANSTAR